MKCRSVEIVGWVLRPVFFYSIVLCLFSCCLPLYVVGVGETSLKYSGLILQIYGFVGSMIMLRRSEKYFSEQTFFSSIFGSIKKYFLDAPFIAKQENHAIGCAVAPLPVVRAFRYQSCPPNSSLEDRIICIEEHIMFLRKTIFDEIIERDKKIGEMRSRLEQRIESNFVEIGQCKKTIENLSIGDIKISYICLVFFIVGTIMTTIPEKIMYFFGRFIISM